MPHSSLIDGPETITILVTYLDPVVEEPIESRG